MANIGKGKSVASTKSKTSEKGSGSKKDNDASKKDKETPASAKDSTATKKGSKKSKKGGTESEKAAVTKSVKIRSSLGSIQGGKKNVVSIRDPKKSEEAGEGDADGSGQSSHMRGRYKRLDPTGDESRAVVADTLRSAISRASEIISQPKSDATISSGQTELERKREAMEARAARDERLRQLGSLGVIEQTEMELYVRRQITAIDAGAAMTFDLTNPADAALAAILQSVVQGGDVRPENAAMHAILGTMAGVTDMRLPPEVREFTQHVLDKATGLLDVDPDSEVGKALTRLVEAVQAGRPEAVAACQLALKAALERALKAPFLAMPTRMGEMAVGHLIASDTLEMALMSVNEALLSGRARIILQEAKEMRRRGEDIWTFMMRMKMEVTRDDQRRENIRRWKRMGGITQVPWTPTKRRGPIAAEYQSPGPACVALPNLIGGAMCVPDSKRARAPAFSFGSRHGGKNESPGPGPGQYNVTGLSAKGKDNPPAASLHSRPKNYKAEQTPAPGDYNPEKSEKMVHDNSPKYTFGLKTQHEKPSSTPAPNVYNIPTVLGATKEGNKKQAPAFTISGRQKEKPDDRVFNPGPGSYNNSKADNYKMRSPAYSISSRYQMPTDSTQKPGPGAHSPEKVYSNRRWAPNYSFGIKHTPFKGDKGFVLVTERPRPTYACTC